MLDIEAFKDFKVIQQLSGEFGRGVAKSINVHIKIGTKSVYFTVNTKAGIVLTTDSLESAIAKFNDI